MEKNEFAELVRQNQQMLYRVAKSILREDEDCMDAIQEAVANGLAGLHNLKQDRYAKTWLTRILIHECYHIASRNQKMVQFEAKDWENYTEITFPQEDYSDLYEAISCISEEYRVVLVLYYVEEYAVREIAKIVEIPQGTVKSRLARGRKQLERELKRMEEKRYERDSLERRVSGNA